MQWLKNSTPLLVLSPLSDGFVTWKIIYTCTFLDWVELHTKRVWPKRSAYFGDKWSSQNTHGQTKLAF